MTVPIVEQTKTAEEVVVAEVIPVEPVVVETPPVVEPVVEVEPVVAEPTDEEIEEGGEELPTWAREKLTKANAEAANYRTRLRDSEATVASLKEEHVTDKAAIVADNRALLIENVALKNKLPKKLADRLKGDTREEIEADAKELAEFFDIEEEELELHGGLTPRRTAEVSGPAALREQHGTRRKR